MDDDVVNAPDNNTNNIEDGRVDETGESLVPELAEDNDTPFSAPTDAITDGTANLTSDESTDNQTATHPVTDAATNIDAHQVYDEGLPAATEASEPNAGNAVTDYHPDEDQRNQ